MKASDILNALRKQYCQPQWAFFSEVSDSTGFSSSRRADGIAMNMWPSRGLELRCFEIKVSKQDLKHELETPEKAEVISRFCNTFYLCTPTGLSKGMDLPPNWGLIEISDDGDARIKKESFYNKEPQEMKRGFVASLLRSAAKISEEEIEAAVSKRTKDLRDSIDSQVARQVKDALDKRPLFYDDCEKFVTKVTDILGEKHISIHDENFWKAVKLVNDLKLTTSWSGFGLIHRDLLAVASCASALAEHLGKGIENLEYFVESSKIEGE